METSLQNTSQSTGGITFNRILRGVGWGLIGGLAGTFAMDLVLMGVLWVFGLSPFSCFSIVGETMAATFAIQASEGSQLVPLGIAAHYIIGPVVGAIYGGALVRVLAFRRLTPKKVIVISIIYVEILSQPILATAPILLGWKVNMIIFWYASAFFMHFIMGFILGFVLSSKLCMTKDRTKVFSER